MQPSQIKDESLIEIGTFLARRWSGESNTTIEFSENGWSRTLLREYRIVLPSIGRLVGDGFQRYRQLRTMLWCESMRLKICEKILSNDHAFGLILNTIESRRAEMLGRRIWAGMDNELVFNYTHQWNYRPSLGSVYGKARVVEGFYQHFTFGDTKGEIAANRLEWIHRASKLAHIILDKAILKGYGTTWIEKQIPDIIRILGIDSLLTVPVALPWMRPDMAQNEEELLKTITKITRNRENDFKKIDPSAVISGRELAIEYKMLADEQKKSKKGMAEADAIGVQIPDKTNVDETVIYDLDLINSLKTKFKDWKTRWREVHRESGDEFDGESYMERHEPFFTDIKSTIDTEIVILLDHSSSISGDQSEYKKATLALCQVLAYLKVKFSVYAFSTVNKAIVCWLIKPDSQTWNSVCAKRLVQIDANGATPLAEVYERMYRMMQMGGARTFLTLTDGEPSDPGAVRAMIKAYRSMGVRMVSLGLGPDILRATAIASNLKRLGYERTLAVSRLGDIPKKVLGILGED